MRRLPPCLSRPRRRLIPVLLTVGVVVTSARTLLAHDFWLVPDAFQVVAGGSLSIRGHSGSKFPAGGSATTPDRVAEARLIGASTDEPIRDLTASGTSLLLRHRPSSAGQQVVALALHSRTTRVAPAQLKRYIALEGAPELAERYEREGRYPADSVSQVAAKFAKTIVEIGGNGPRAFTKVAGHALELLPLDDPSLLRVGDSLRVRVLYRGHVVPRVHLRAGVAPTASGEADASSAPKDLVVETDADGVARVEIMKNAGLWNVRTLYASPRSNDASSWDLYFATLVFKVGR
ncbi:DUF4198 domain-containing protein [Gemmatimonas sp.]